MNPQSKGWGFSTFVQYADKKIGVDCGNGENINSLEARSFEMMRVTVHIEFGTNTEQLSNYNGDFHSAYGRKTVIFRCVFVVCGKKTV